MQATLKAISEQLELCSALMSDPQFLRSQPGFVATQFDTALARIEELGVFLNIPEKPEGWLDQSVLEAGIKPLASHLLRRLMQPLRLEKFPRVFELDLKPNQLGPGAENPIEREIRETNCMGAMVVLSYYVLWYALLIKLNSRPEDDVNLQEFVDRLPKGSRLLEMRTLHRALADEGRKGHLVQSGVQEAFMFDQSAGVRPTRTTMVVSVVRDVLDTITGDDRLRRATTGLHMLIVHKLVSHAELFGGLVATVDWADDTAKWNDMYADVEIVSEQRDAQRKEQGLYTYKLAKVLKSPPYNDEESFALLARPLAIYDYACVGLLVDVCKSALTLRRLLRRLHDGVTHETIEAVILQACGSQDQLLRNLRGINKPESFYYDTGFVSENRKARNATRMTQDMLKGRVFVDDLVGYYWESKFSEYGNHQFLSWAGLTVDPDADAPPLDRIQHICEQCNQTEGDENAKKVVRNFVIARCIAPAVRNSLLVASILKSAMKFAERRKCRVPITVLPAHLIPYAFPDENLRPLFGYDHQACPDYIPRPIVAENTTVTLAQAIEQLKLEYAVYLAYVEQLRSKQMTKYAGLSWPVRFEDGNSNFNQWKLVRSVPVRIPSLNASAASVATSVELIAERLQHRN